MLKVVQIPMSVDIVRYLYVFGLLEVATMEKIYLRLHNALSQSSLNGKVTNKDTLRVRVNLYRTKD
jgi:hypothetical protein